MVAKTRRKKQAVVVSLAQSAVDAPPTTSESTDSMDSTDAVNAIDPDNMSSFDTFLATAFGQPLRIALLRALAAHPAGLARNALAQMFDQESAENITHQLHVLLELGCVELVSAANTEDGIAGVEVATDVTDATDDTTLVPGSYQLAQAEQTTMLRSLLATMSGGSNALPQPEESAPQQTVPWQQVNVLREVIAAIPEAVVLADANGHLLLTNEVAEQLWGQPAPENITTEAYASVFNTYSPNGNLIKAQDMMIPTALSGETVIGKQIIYQRPDGQRLDLLCNAAPIYEDAPSGKYISGAVCTFQDISHLKMLERQRDEFLSIAAHELRTPLTSILGTVQVLLRQMSRITDEKPMDLVGLKRGLERVNDQSQRINKLVSDLLDTSRIQAGRLEFTLTTVDLGVVVSDAIEGQEMAHPGRRIIATLPEHPLFVTGDAMRLGQVFDNLLTNAFKYSAEMEPVEVKMQAVGRKEVRVSVRDHGDGIPQAALPHLFERFYRVPGVEVKTDSGVGLGLGLYITHTIVTRHEGRIEVASKPGQGTTFHVTLPLAQALPSSEV